MSNAKGNFSPHNLFRLRYWGSAGNAQKLYRPGKGDQRSKINASTKGQDTQDGLSVLQINACAVAYVCAVAYAIQYVVWEQRNWLVLQSKDRDRAQRGTSWSV